jgi:hypothetical protein
MGLVVSFMSWPLFPLGRALCTHCIGGWVGPTVSVNALEAINPLPVLGIEPKFLCRLARRLVTADYAFSAPIIKNTVMLFTLPDTSI